MNLITLQEAKDQLEVDHDDSDAFIGSLIASASGAVLNYMKGCPIGQPKRDEQGAVIIDADGNIQYARQDGALVIRYEVQAAVKIMVAELFKNREAEQDGEVSTQHGYGYLPRPVIALLYPLRDPAVA